MDGGVPRRSSYEVNISQHIRFPRVCSHVTDFNARNKILRAKLLPQGYRYHKLRKTFPKFYRRHYELVSKFNVGLKTFCAMAHQFLVIVYVLRFVQNLLHTSIETIRQVMEHS